MADNTKEIVVAAGGSIRVAPVGTAPPVDESVAFAGTWVDLGAVSDEGAKVKRDISQEAIKVWRTKTPAKRFITEVNLTVELTLREWNELSIPLAFGGGAWVANGAGKVRYSIPSTPSIDERAFALDWTSEGYKYRLIIPRGMVIDQGDIVLQGTAPSDLPITIGVNASDTNPLADILTNDPDITP
jgi:hypothetical protein